MIRNVFQKWKWFDWKCSLQEVDEFIIELPRSFDGKETVQSNKV